jgi:hypothetical protein
MAGENSWWDQAVGNFSQGKPNEWGPGMDQTAIDHDKVAMHASILIVLGKLRHVSRLMQTTYNSGQLQAAVRESIRELTKYEPKETER